MGVGHRNLDRLPVYDQMLLHKSVEQFSILVRLEGKSQI